MGRWHNILGENGQRLTILSLLAHPGGEPPGALPTGELTLQQAVDEIFRLAGDDGEAQVVLSVTDENDGSFLSEEHVPLQDLVDRLYAAYGDDDEAVLRFLGPGDDPLSDGRPGDHDEVGDPDDDLGIGPLATLRRLRETVHQLFGGSAEEGVPPTVLSLLVGPKRPDPPAPDHP
jgi:hypothetical protein